MKNQSQRYLDGLRAGWLDASNDCRSAIAWWSEEDDYRRGYRCGQRDYYAGIPMLRQQTGKPCEQ